MEEIALHESDVKQNEHRQPIQVKDEDLRAYVQKNAQYYLDRFSRFDLAGHDQFRLSWNWPAFFFGCWWALYRKMYLVAAVSFAAIVLVDKGALLILIVMGCVANFLYYKRAKTVIIETKLQHGTDSDVSRSLIERSGGVHKWVAPVGIFLHVFFVLAYIASLIMQNS